MSKHGILPSAGPVPGRILSPIFFLGMLIALPGVAGAESGIQVLTRGPVHEAFAAASMGGSLAGEIITRAPYEPIVELPPDLRPTGDDVAWIPGYWSWDEDRNDFIWVSGVWRDLPPGRQWVPGYWAVAGNGSQWISGFWADAAYSDVTYLPPPPEPLELGPSSPAPYPGTLWAPGSWVWQQSRYAWQPGYWVAQQPDWVWSPAHYVWTPRGHVYVPGYWDHDIAHRGVIFAPVYYEQPVYRRPDYHYSPAFVIDLGVVAAFLFVQPRSRHYYFGDYYDARYERRGYYPWHEAGPGRRSIDPLYLQYRTTQLRRDQDWDIHVDERYRHRRDHAESRPPQTLDIQINLNNTRRSDSAETIVIGRSLAETARTDSSTRRFSTLGIEERNQIGSRARGVRVLQTERAKLEAPAGRGRGDERGIAQPERLRMPVSPVASRPDRSTDRMKTPPPPPDAPRSGAPQRTDLNRGRAQNETAPAPASSLSARKPVPRLAGPPESRTPRPNAGRENPHPVVKRLDIPVGRAVPDQRPAAGPKGNRTSLQERRPLPPVAVESDVPVIRDPSPATRVAVPPAVRDGRSSAGPSRGAPVTIEAPKEVMRKQPATSQIQRPGTGAKSQRSKTLQPSAEESTPPRGRTSR